MNRRTLVLAVAATHPAFLLAQRASAQPAPIRIYVSNGIRAAVEQLRLQCERAAGHPLAIEYSAAALLKKRIDAGEPFDAVLLTAEATDALVQEGKVAAATRVDVARAGLGLGIRSGGRKPDLGSPEAFQRALLSAKSITYAKDGASRALIEKIYDRLGIAAAVQPKVILQTAPDTPQTAVASGQAEMLIAPVSEILPAHGVELAGRLPEDLQSYIRFQGGVSANTGNAEASRVVIQFFSGPRAAAAYRALGLEPAH